MSEKENSQKMFPGSSSTAKLEISFGLWQKASWAMETIKQISQLLCGKDEFDGDLVQYVKNQIQARRQLEIWQEAALAAARHALEICQNNQKEPNPRLVETLQRLAENDLPAAGGDVLDPARALAALPLQQLRDLLPAMVQAAEQLKAKLTSMTQAAAEKATEKAVMQAKDDFYTLVTDKMDHWCVKLTGKPLEMGDGEEEAEAVGMTVANFVQALRPDVDGEPLPSNVALQEINKQQAERLEKIDQMIRKAFTTISFDEGDTVEVVVEMFIKVFEAAKQTNAKYATLVKDLRNALLGTERAYLQTLQWVEYARTACEDNHKSLATINRLLKAAEG